MTAQPYARVAVTAQGGRFVAHKATGDTTACGIQLSGTRVPAPDDLPCHLCKNCAKQGRGRAR
ncbi:MAG: hypothetical protein Q8O56_14020 [Solirubrobacteraceae bacterium]|nr:hypothetical protein [Solirubrobacteraceae bacterium]